MVESGFTGGSGVPYEAILVRPREPWLDFEITCNGVTVSYRPGFENGLALICQALRNAGYPDGPMRIIERTRSGLRQDIPSIFRVSELPVTYVRQTADERASSQIMGKRDGSAPSPAVSPSPSLLPGGLSQALQAGLARLIADESSWPGLAPRVKGTLVERAFVMVHEGKKRASVTEEGRVAYARSLDPDEPASASLPVASVPDVVSEREAATVEAPDPSVRRELEAVPDRASDESVSLESVKGQAPATLDVAVSAKQREAIELVVRQPDAWRSIHGRTRQFLIGAGWVQIGWDDRPALTDQGARLAASLGLP